MRTSCDATCASHFPHKISALFRDIVRAPSIVDALTGVIGPNVKMMQSMLFIKAEGKPGQAWHQDETHIPTRDRSLTAAWIALDDATVENGCLWVIPGSHRRGVLYPVRDQPDSRFDCTQEAYRFGYREADAVPVELFAGAAPAGFRSSSRGADVARGVDSISLRVFRTLASNASLAPGD
jgi:phytanoyl-CoA hydroxylase